MYEEALVVITRALGVDDTNNAAMLFCIADESKDRSVEKSFFKNWDDFSSILLF